MSADGRLIATGAADGTLVVREVGGPRVGTLGAGEAAGAARVDPGRPHGGRGAAGRGGRRGRRRHRVPVRACSASNAEDALTVASRPGDGTIASAGRAGDIRLWDGTDGGRVIADLGVQIYLLAFSPDGRRLAAAVGDDTVRVYDLTGADEPTVLRGRFGAPYAVAFSGDGETLAVGGERGLRIWDWRRGVILLTVARAQRRRLPGGGRRGAARRQLRLRQRRAPDDLRRLRADRRRARARAPAHDALPHRGGAHRLQDRRLDPPGDREAQEEPMPKLPQSSPFITDVHTAKLSIPPDAIVVRGYLGPPRGVLEHATAILGGLWEDDPGGALHRGQRLHRDDPSAPGQPDPQPAKVNLDKLHWRIYLTARLDCWVEIADWTHQRRPCAAGEQHRSTRGVHGLAAAVHDRRHVLPDPLPRRQRGEARAGRRVPRRPARGGLHDPQRVERRGVGGAGVRLLPTAASVEVLLLARRPAG